MGAKPAVACLSVSRGRGHHSRLSVCHPFVTLRLGIARYALEGDAALWHTDGPDWLVDQKACWDKRKERDALWLLVCGIPLLFILRGEHRSSHHSTGGTSEMLPYL